MPLARGIKSVPSITTKLPIVSCPRCGVVMPIKTRAAMRSSADMDIVVYHCDLCGDEISRKIKRDVHWPP